MNFCYDISHSKQFLSLPGHLNFKKVNVVRFRFRRLSTYCLPLGVPNSYWLLLDMYHVFLLWKDRLHWKRIRRVEEREGGVHTWQAKTRLSPPFLLCLRSEGASRLGCFVNLHLIRNIRKEPRREVKKSMGESFQTSLEKKGFIPSLSRL